MFMTLQASTCDLRKYDNSEDALKHSIEINQNNIDYSTFYLYKVGEEAKTLRCIASLRIKFGTNDFHWEKVQA